MSEKPSFEEIYVMQEDVQPVLDKMEKGTATMEDIKTKSDTFERLGMLEVRSAFSNDPRARGAEGRVESKSYDLEDIQSGVVIDEPNNPESSILVEFTDKSGVKNQARLDYRLGKFFKPETYKGIEPLPA